MNFQKRKIIINLILILVKLILTILKKLTVLVLEKRILLGKITKMIKFHRW